jgi:hypothetical protein
MLHTYAVQLAVATDGTVEEMEAGTMRKLPRSPTSRARELGKMLKGRVRAKASIRPLPT